MATRHPEDVDTARSARFARWPGLLSLSAGVLVGPVVALLNEGLIYVSNMWACGAGTSLALHVVPALCFAAAVAAGLLARADWMRVGRGTQAEDGTVVSRSRFLALSGMALSGISALVILAQWLAIFVFGPCRRA